MAHASTAGCDDKIKYPSRGAARVAKGSMAQRGASKYDLQTYLCFKCGSWHLGGSGIRRAKNSHLFRPNRLKRQLGLDDEDGC